MSNFSTSIYGKEQNLHASLKILSMLVLITLVSVFAHARSRHSSAASQPSDVQTYTPSVVYAFQVAPDGSLPVAGLIRDNSGNLFGVTASGGEFGNGSVFELTPNGSGGYTYKQIFSNDLALGGYAPQYLTMDGQGNLYVCTSGGSLGPYGAVFELSLGQDGYWSLTNDYAFTGGSDGLNPIAVVIDPSGTFYGVAGDLFELTTTDNQWFEQTLFTFSNNQMGGGPDSLTLDKNGDFYGTTATGGVGGGVVFKLHNNARLGWVETILHYFQQDSQDGGYPLGPLTSDKAGNIYGTVASGLLGHGGVYKITKAGQITWLYSFTGGNDGAHPTNGVSFDKAGNLYGTASYGGGVNQYCDGCGTVFKLTPPAVGQTSWTETTLFNFDGGADGNSPNGPPLIDDAGNLFLSAMYGGVSYGNAGWGTVVELLPDPVPTATTITKDAPNPSVVGRAVTIGFTVAQTIQGFNPPTGTVTVMANTGEGCMAPIQANGKGSCEIQFVTAGARTLTATYSGDAGDQSSTATVSQSVFEPTTTTITRNAPDPAKLGEAVTVGFSVESKDATKGTKPTGSVTVNASSGESCTGALNAGGKGNCQLTFSSSGSRTLTATYPGDADNEESTSRAVSETVR